MYRSKIRRLQYIGWVTVVLLIVLSSFHCLKIRYFIRETVVVSAEDSSDTAGQPATNTDTTLTQDAKEAISLEPGEEVQETIREGTTEYRNNSFHAMLIAGILQCLTILALRLKLNIVLSLFMLLVTFRTWLACMLDIAMEMGGLGCVEATLTPIGYIVVILAIANVVCAIVTKVLEKRYIRDYPVDPVQQQQSLEQAMAYMTQSH